MALTRFRWIAAAIAGCLMVAVIALRDDGPDRRPGTDYQLSRRADRFGRRLQRAALRLRFAQLEDSLKVGEPAASSAAITVRPDPALPEAVRAELDSVAWNAVRDVRDVRDEGAVGIDFVFTQEVGTTVRGVVLGRYGTSVHYVLPTPAHMRCTVIAMMARGATSAAQLAEVRTPAVQRQLVGPCAYYRAFGMPGTQVDAWLRARGWKLVGNGSWTEPPRPNDMTKADVWDPLERAALLMGAESVPFLTRMNVNGLRCVSGESDACGQALLSPTPSGGNVWRGNVLLGAYPQLSSDDAYYGRPLGPRESTLMAAMVRTLGRERFARFWRSNDDVPSAFRAASGESLTDWTVRWARSEYGPPPARGAGVSAWAAAESVLLIVLGLGLGMGVSARRTFA